MNRSQLQPASSASVEEAYLPLGGRATWVRRILAAVVLVDVVALATELLLLDPTNPGEGASREAVAIAAGVEILIVLTQLFLALLAGVMFILWLHRAYANLRFLGATGLRYGKGWTIGAWFVPILNLWRPKQVINDVWRASDRELPPDQGTGWRSVEPPSLYTWWWTAYLVSVLVPTAGAAYVSASDPSLVAELTVVSLLVDIGAALLAMAVVGRTTARQGSRADRVSREGMPKRRRARPRGPTTRKPPAEDPPASTPGGTWLPDPEDEATWRYWDGARWTEHTAD